MADFFASIWPLLPPAGTAGPLFFAARRRELPGGRGQVYLLSDVTEKRRRTTLRSEMMDWISHELKTPMTTIAGYADGILDGVISPEEEKQYLRIISDESRRLSRLVRRMLDVSQLQSLDLIKQKKPFDLSESMRRVLVSM